MKGKGVDGDLNSKLSKMPAGSKPGGIAIGEGTLEETKMAAIGTAAMAGHDNGDIENMPKRNILIMDLQKITPKQMAMKMMKELKLNFFDTYQLYAVGNKNI